MVFEMFDSSHGRMNNELTEREEIELKRLITRKIRPLIETHQVYQSWGPNEVDRVVDAKVDEIFLGVLKIFNIEIDEWGQGDMGISEPKQ